METKIDDFVKGFVSYAVNILLAFYISIKSFISWITLKTAKWMQESFESDSPFIVSGAAFLFIACVVSTIGIPLIESNVTWPDLTDSKTLEKIFLAAFATCLSIEISAHIIVYGPQNNSFRNDNLDSAQAKKQINILRYHIGIHLICYAIIVILSIQIMRLAFRLLSAISDTGTFYTKTDYLFWFLSAIGGLSLVSLIGKTYVEYSRFSQTSRPQSFGSILKYEFWKLLSVIVLAISLPISFFVTERIYHILLKEAPNNAVRDLQYQCEYNATDNLIYVRTTLYNPEKMPKFSLPSDYIIGSEAIITAESNFKNVNENVIQVKMQTVTDESGTELKLPYISGEQVKTFVFKSLPLDQSQATYVRGRENNCFFFTSWISADALEHAIRPKDQTGFHVPEKLKVTNAHAPLPPPPPPPE